MAVLRRTNEEHDMPGNPREIITMAERRFPVRVRIGVPPGGLGRRLTQITAWLDENCGSDGSATTPSGGARVAERCDLALFRGCDARQRLCCTVVRRG